MFYPEDGGMTPQPKPRGGMFGGKTQDVIMAAIAGFMARQNPQLAQSMMGIMQQKRQQAMDEQNYQRERADKRDDFVFQNQWKLDHDQPEYGEFERALMASGVQPGTPQWADAMKRRTDNMLDPIVSTMQGTMPRSVFMGGGMQAPPTMPVGPLTPIDDEGGAGSPAPRPFPY